MTRRRKALALVGAAAAVAITAAGTASAATSNHHRAGGSGDWPTWQGTTTGSRTNPAEKQITAQNVGHLTLKWAFAFPKVAGDAAARSQPAVVGNRIYFGGPDGTFRSLDAHTGKTQWTYDLSTVGPKAPTVVLDGPTVHGDSVYVGDSRGYLFALNRWTGALRWTSHDASQPTGIHTSSPLYYQGRVYIGASSGENALGKDSPCCSFRGHVDAVDARTGKLAWRYYTVPKAHRDGSWPNGQPRYSPSGAGVWSSPAIDPATGTLYVGTGQNYTGSAGNYDSVLALNARTGAVRWIHRMTDVDTWRSTCNGPDSEKYCPGLHDGTALDYDLGSSPNIFRVHGQTRIGIGQKSGVYHVLDARTGKIIWQRQLSQPLPSGGITGIQWGTSYDGRRIYAATYYSEPSMLYALDPATGRTIWRTHSPASGCTTGGAAKYKTCSPTFQPPVSSSPGVVWEGSTDGKLRAFSAATGKVAWQYDTVRDFTGVNGLIGHGSQLPGGAGAVVSHGMVYTNSGYPGFDSPHGFVLLAFGH